MRGNNNDIMIMVITILLMETIIELNDYYGPGTELPTLHIVLHLILIIFLYIRIITPYL